MPLPPEIILHQPEWLEEASPCNHVVVTSRARFARNLDNHPFSPHAPSPILARVHGAIQEALARNPYFEDFFRLELATTSGLDRAFLKESRLISKEMERGGESRAVYIRADLKCSVMVNEEDHLRLQCFEAGLQTNKAQERLRQLDAEVARVLAYARSDRFGYLTACPSNMGTGLRISVMMHLPGLTLRRELEEALKGLPSRGLTVRGFYGENSENIGDFFQISNEVTLGKPVDAIEENLASAVGTIMEKELEARSLLHREGGLAVLDSIWRSYGILTSARRMDSMEAMKLLSRLRLGVDEGLFPGISHGRLNRLIVEIQPGHLILRRGATDETEQRDFSRAALLREYLAEAAQ